MMGTTEVRAITYVRTNDEAEARRRAEPRLWEAMEVMRIEANIEALKGLEPDQDGFEATPVDADEVPDELSAGGVGVVFGCQGRYETDMRGVWTREGGLDI